MDLRESIAVLGMKELELSTPQVYSRASSASSSGSSSGGSGNKFLVWFDWKRFGPLMRCAILKDSYVEALLSDTSSTFYRTFRFDEW